MPIGDQTTPEDEAIASDIVDAAYKVHSKLGAGLLEPPYERCLGYELEKRGRRVVYQLQVPLEYDDLRFDVGFRIDLLVDDRVIVEVKAVERLLPVHTAQVVTYLKLMKLQLGILVNFNVPLIRDGIKRVVRFK